VNKRDDVDLLYGHTKILAEVCKYLFWGNCIISLVATLSNGKLHLVLTYIQIIGALLFVISKSVDDGLLWYNAEMARRKNSIQVALNVPLAEIETKGYYNNELAPSLSKYALNTFESNYFSRFVAGKMLIKSAVMALLSVAALIVTGWLISDGDVLLIITQAVFSAYIIEDAVVLAIYKVRMDKLYEEAYSAFVTFGINEDNQKAWLLAYAVEYEAIKAHYKVRIDSKIFKKHNDELSRKWDIIRQKIMTN
jgi:hypothetical protein